MGWFRLGVTQWIACKACGYPTSSYVDDTACLKCLRHPVTGRWEWAPALSAIVGLGAIYGMVAGCGVGVFRLVQKVVEVVGGFHSAELTHVMNVGGAAAGLLFVERMRRQGNFFPRPPVPPPMPPHASTALRCDVQVGRILSGAVLAGALGLTFEHELHLSGLDELWVQLLLLAGIPALGALMGYFYDLTRPNGVRAG